MEKLTSAPLSAYTSLTASGLSHRESKRDSYCQVVNYLQATYVTNNIITKADVEITSFRQLDRQNAVE